MPDEAPVIRAVAPGKITGELNTMPFLYSGSGSEAFCQEGEFIVVRG
jgi:hypothetical protein